MRRAAAVLMVLCLATMFAGPALAQGKDPFLPPPGAGPDVFREAGPAPPGSVSPGEAAGPDDGLARTGQDVSAQLAFGLVLLTLGCALRLAERGAAMGVSSG